jgi:enolase
MVAFWKSWVDQFPIVSIEDGLAQDDWEGWKMMTKELGDRLQIVGDDLLVTNPERIQKAIEEKSCNSLLVKVNQIGSLTETIEAVELCQRAGWTAVTSHRSGETEDSPSPIWQWRSTGADQDRCTRPLGPRVAKYNQLLCASKADLGDSGTFAGWDALKTKR